MIGFILGLLLGTMLGQEVQELPRMTRIVHVIIQKTKATWKDEKDSIKD